MHTSCINGAYFTIFSGLFFLFEGFGIERGVKNPGFFFTIQMGVMIVIRLFGGGIFDKFSKVALVAIALLITGAGFILLLCLEASWILPISTVFGIGMGLCVPPLNSLMYLVTRPQYRGYNASMMMLSIHFSTFMGRFCQGLDNRGRRLRPVSGCRHTDNTGCCRILFHREPIKDIEGPLHTDAV